MYFFVYVSDGVEQLIDDTLANLCVIGSVHDVLSDLAYPRLSVKRPHHAVMSKDPIHLRHCKPVFSSVSPDVTIDILFAKK